MNETSHHNIWFFVDRSIGVTMLGFHLLEVVHISMRIESQGRFFLVYSKPSPVYASMLALYPYVEFVDIRKWFGLYAGWLFLRFALQKNLCMFAPAFGKPSLHMRMFARMLTVFRHNSCTIGYAETPSVSDWLWYNKCVTMDINKNIFDTVIDSLPLTMRTERFQPTLLFSFDTSFHLTLPKHYIVVHPFAANEGRTYPDRYTIRLLRFLRENYRNYFIIITGGPENEGRARKLIDEVGGGIKYVSYFNPKNDFPKTMQIVAGADMYIGVDTGITHLAAHLRVATVVLGVLSNPMWLPTYSSNSKILFSRKNCVCNGNKTGDCFTEIDGKKYYRCMVDIPWQEIVSVIQLQLHE